MKNVSTIICIVIIFLSGLGCAPGPAGIDGTQDISASRQAADSYQSAERVAETVADASDDVGEGNSASVSEEYVQILINARQFEYDPSDVAVRYGDNVMLTVTSIDVGHGFALPDFGINERVPPEESVTFIFIADKKGEFDFFNSVYSGKDWKKMRGTFTVK